MGLNSDQKEVAEKDSDLANGNSARPSVYSGVAESRGDRETPVHSPAKSERGASKSLQESSKGPRSPAAILKPRPSRWADEEEDDMFIPIRSAFSSSAKPVTSPRPSRRQTTEKEPLRPTTRPSKPERGYKAAVPVVCDADRGYTPRAAVPVESSRYADLDRGYKPHVVDSERGNKLHVAPPIDPVALDELSHMKETMAKKAEARKKEKAEEEARLEAERKARCLAKLKEIEDRKKKEEPKRDEPKRDDRPKTPKKVTLIGVKAKATQIQHDPSHREAYILKRQEVGHQRGYQIPEAAQTNLSAEAVEFVPWQPFPYYPPQVPPYWY